MFKKLKKSLESEHLSASAKRTVREALHKIDRQAAKYDAADAEEKREIRSQMQREMKSIQREFEQKDAEFEEEDDEF